MMTHILIVILYLSAFAFIQRRVVKGVREYGQLKHINTARVSLVSKFITILLFFLTLSLMAISLGLGYQDVSLFVSSAFAVLGVALFAQWSILSNLTAGILIFFVFPYKVGERIRIVDADEDISGILQEVALFHLLIKRDNGDTITYPNSLVLQKAVLKLQYQTAVAKDTETPAADEEHRQA
ncbi:mechanosensitive ion channel family protein [Shewanella yunxiaonensis]|uniref:Small-conductance mechanosensitive channel n=1 Tax=Shewanella yunxiaonensis TaxID=2829809 RepID=A0ABX7YRW6_9GAMM|nr:MULTISPECIES: mechanosensitive ion channel family protein [Shewanella]MDF0533926.1 mechanosensitive ion channel family protein [Shewanella sp. A32]QUN05258.1 mechanosensitive ion channel family protein [Shewanella yunxiaonensis]